MEYEPDGKRRSGGGGSGREGKGKNGGEEGGEQDDDEDDEDDGDRMRGWNGQNPPGLLAAAKRTEIPR